MKRSRSSSWIAPAEVFDSAPRDVGFAVPVDARGRFNPAYAFEVFKYGQDSVRPTTEAFEVRLAETDALELRINEARLVFRRKQRGARTRSFRYGGEFRSFDFDESLVEVEPDPLELVDELFLSRGLVLIGCDPSAHDAGWSDRAERLAGPPRAVGSYKQRF